MQCEGIVYSCGKRGSIHLRMHISPYEKGNIFNKDPMRVRKLLLHRHEINKIEGSLQEKGLTLVPLKVYFKDSLVKLEIGVARGKSCMTRDRILRRKTSGERQKENSKSKICNF